jgi:hypothetical protein
MDVIKKSFSALFLFIFLTAAGNSFAQTRPGVSGSQPAKFYFDKPITLDSLTRFVHSHSKIRFSFNSTKVKGNKLINLKKGSYSIEQLLQQIRNNTSLYYTMYNGYVIFQDNPPKPKTKTPPVVKTGKPKPPIKKAAVASHQKPAPKLNIKTNTQQPAPVIQPQQTPQADTVKLKTDSLLSIDSVLVIARGDSLNQLVIPRKPQLQGNAPDDSTLTRNRLTLSGWPRIQLGLVPVDTTKIDTLQKKDTPNIAKPPVTTAAIKKKKKARNAAASAKNNVYYDTEGNDWRWQFGLQWKGALPLYGTQNHFTGINTRSEPYNLLIPGAWVSATANYRHEIMLQVKPAEWHYYNKNAFRNDTSFTLQQRPDSIIRYDTIRTRRSNSLLKTSSWHASLQYNYHINNHLMIGAGIGYNLQLRGLTTRQSYLVSTGALQSDSLYSMENDTLTSRYLASSFVTGKLEMAYRFKALDVGATVVLPLTDAFTEKSLNKSRPLNLQLFVRWRIRRDED